MPREIFDTDEFLKIANSLAEYCEVKRLDNVVKLKLRTPKHLITYKVEPKLAESIIAELPIEIFEV